MRLKEMNRIHHIVPDLIRDGYDTDRFDDEFVRIIPHALQRKPWGEPPQENVAVDMQTMLFAKPSRFILKVWSNLIQQKVERAEDESVLASCHLDLNQTHLLLGTERN